MTNEDYKSTQSSDSPETVDKPVHLEVGATKTDMQQDGPFANVANIKTFAIAFGISFATAVFGFVLLMFAPLLAINAHPLTIAIIGAALLIIALGLVFFIESPQLPNTPRSVRRRQARILKEYTA